jgi:hypothetical protein
VGDLLVRPLEHLLVELDDALELFDRRIDVLAEAAEPVELRLDLRDVAPVAPVGRLQLRFEVVPVGTEGVEALPFGLDVVPDRFEVVTRVAERPELPVEAVLLLA